MGCCPSEWTRDPAAFLLWLSSSVFDTVCTYSQFSLFTHCLSIYLLEKVNHQNHGLWQFLSHSQTLPEWWKLWAAQHSLSQLVLQTEEEIRWHLVFLSPQKRQCLCCNVHSVTFFVLLLISLLQTAPKHSGKALQKNVMRFPENTVTEASSHLSYESAAHDLRVNEYFIPNEVLLKWNTYNASEVVIHRWKCCD